MRVRRDLIIIKEIAENYKIKELVLESMKKNQSINSFCVEATSREIRVSFTHALGIPVSSVRFVGEVGGFIPQWLKMTPTLVTKNFCLAGGGQSRSSKTNVTIRVMSFVFCSLITRPNVQ